MRRFYSFFCALMLGLGFLWQGNSPPTQASDEDTRLADILNEMTLEQKVGQLFMVNISGSELGEKGTEFIQTSTPGAIAIFGFNTEGQSAADLTDFLNQLQTASMAGVGVPLIIATDQEGGLVRRVTADVTAFPNPLYLGAVTESDGVQRIGAAVGRELAAVGINMNLAPVADLHTRGDFFNSERVMHQRTFGDDPRRVGEQVAWYTQGLAEAGVIGVIKHYPGHGGAADSHAGLPVLQGDYETLSEGAMLPFKIAVENGVPAIMVGHLYYAQIEPVPDLPASLSPTMLGFLRDEWGFEGVIMTDAMDMAGVANNFYVPDAAVQFIQAGGDMFVAGPYLDWNTQRAAMAQILTAVERGEISEARLDESVRRILQLKADYGLLDWQPLDPATALDRIDKPASQTALVETFMDSATLLQDEENLLPLNPEDDVAIVYHMLSESILTTCGELSPNAVFHGYVYQPARWEYGAVAQLGREHEKIVIITEDAFFTPAQQDLVKTLPPEKTILVALNMPYDVEVFEGISTVITMYQNQAESQQAVCRMLFGEQPFTGRLPIELKNFPSGSGLD